MVGAEGMRGVVAGRLGDRRLPALIAATAAGDASVLARVLESSYNDLAGGAGSLMARALVCSSPGAADRSARAERESRSALFAYPLDNLMVQPEFCGALGGPVRRPGDGGAVRSERPALFITGTLDDRTPPANAASVRAGFPHSVHLLVENGGHETLPADAVQQAVVDFFLGRDVSGRRLVVPAPTFATLDEARRPPRRPGS
jgi:pimeloyl-ACP methyl ester carboxylesterase